MSEALREEGVPDAKIYVPRKLSLGTVIRLPLAFVECGTFGPSSTSSLIAAISSYIFFFSSR